MTVAEAAAKLGGTVVCGEGHLERDVAGAYVSDLLSDVIANAQEGDLWITLQRHVNIIAVAHLKGLAAVVIVNSRQPEQETVTRAVEEQVPIVSTPLSTFDAAGTLYSFGLRGRRAL
jgi:predicted transcriptional regulator